MIKNKKNAIIFIISLLAVVTVTAVLLIIFLFLLPVRVTFYDNNNIMQTIYVNKSGTINEKNVPSFSKEGYTFAGWYEDPSFYTKADFSKPIIKATSFYAKYSPKKLSIRIFCNDGSNNYYDIQGEYNYLIKLYDENNVGHKVLTNSPNHKDFILTGFKTSLNSPRIYTLDEQVAMKGNTIYYAVWQGKKQMISFKTDNAIIEGQPFIKENITVNYGDYYTVNLSEFAGVVHETTQTGILGLMIEDGNGTVYRNGERIKIEGPTQFSLVFMEVGASIVIEYNNGQPSKIITPGESFVLDAPVPKQFHSCIGYFTSNLTYEQILANNITTIPAGTNITNAESGTYYFAIWQPVSVKIEFDSNNGETVVGETDDIDTRFGQTVYLMPNGFSVLNYKFLGWAFADDADSVDFINGQIIVINDDMMTHVTGGKLTLYAVWEALTIKITYHNNDGTNSYIIKDYPINNPAYLEASLTRENYSFRHWASSYDGTGDIYAANALFDAGTTSFSLYAIWQGNPMSVRIGTYEPADNFDEVDASLKLFTISYGDDYEVNLAPFSNVISAAKGASVKGFMIEGGDGTIYWNGSKITVKADINLLLCFLSEEESAVIDFNNGDQKALFAPGSVIDFASYNPIKEKYTLLGYCTKNIKYTDVDSNRIYNINETVSDTPAGTVYYAIWEPEVVYVIFDANNSDAIGTLGKVTSRVGDNVVIWEENYTAAGWTFLGWSKNNEATKADFIAGNLLLINISDIIVNPNDENTVTLYAVWEVININITFNYNGGSGGLSTVSFHANHFSKLTDEYFIATRTNYEVVGWSYNPFEDPESSNIIKAGDPWFYADPNQTIIYMIWRPELKTVSFNTIGALRNGSSFTVSSKNIRYGSDLSIDFSEFLNVRQNTQDRLYMKGLVISGGDGTLYNTENNIVTVLNNMTFNILYYQEYECVLVRYQMPFGGSNPYRDIYLPNINFTLLEKTHNYYTLLGYSLDNEVGEAVYLFGNAYNFPAGSVLYAQWKPKEIAVILETFNALDKQLYIDTLYVAAEDWFEAPDIDFYSQYGIELKFEFWSFEYERYSSSRFEPNVPIELSVYNLYFYGYLDGENPCIKLYAVFNDDAVIFHFTSGQNGGEFDETIVIYVGQSAEAPVIIPYYDKLHFDGWFVHDESIGYFDGVNINAVNQGETWVEAVWIMDDVQITFNSGEGIFVTRYYKPDTYAVLPDHNELMHEDFGFWHDYLGIYAWQDGTSGTVFQANWWHPNEWENFNVGWNDIELIAEWATPVDLFWANEWHWYGGLSITFNGDRNYEHEIIVPKIFYGKPVDVLDYGCFERMPNIRKIKIPETVFCIMDSAFYNCTNLEEIIYGGRISEIGNFAFANCANLRLINFGFSDNISFIGEWAFSNCVSLEEALMDVSFVGDLRMGAFANCFSLKRIGFRCPAVGDFAFIGCSELEFFDFSNISHIGIGAFANCTRLQGLDLINTNYIGAMAFSGCHSIGYVYLPYAWQLWEMGTGAFAMTNSTIHVRGVNNIEELNDNFQGRWQSGWYDATCTLIFGW